LYAIIKSGGKQYRVKKGAFIDVELLDGEPGSQIEFAEILFVYDGSNSIIGAPHLSDYVVLGELVDCVSGPKIKSMKYKRSHNVRKRFGHRQHYSRVEIKDVQTRETKKRH